MHAYELNATDTQPAHCAPEDARTLLDDYASGQLAADELSRQLVEICTADAEESWAILAWLDQYHRRGAIAESLFLELKKQIVRVAIPGQPLTRELDRDPSIPELYPTEYSTPFTAPPSLPQVDSEPVSEARVHETAGGARYAPGTVLRDRYELTGELGRGGMGTVYRARDRERGGLDGLTEYVALKILRDDWSTRPEALAALRQECFRAQLLSHPNIVNVFDWDRDGDTCFVTMELVDGEVLSRVLERIRPRKLARNDALAILEAIGGALVHAHANGVVHADLKPGNVIIGHDGRVRVLDFGLARPVLREPSVGGSDSRALRAATPAYASPEVLRGVNAVPRDDVFSYACLAYELLSGAPPFPRQSVQEARRGRPMPRRPRGLKGREWRVVRRALSPQRDDRPASVEALIDVFTDDTVRRVPPLRALIEKAQQPPRRGVRLLLAAAGLAALAAIAALLLPTLELPPIDLRPAPEPDAVVSVQSRTPAADEPMAADTDAAIARTGSRSTSLENEVRVPAETSGQANQNQPTAGTMTEPVVVAEPTPVRKAPEVVAPQPEEARVVAAGPPVIGMAAGSITVLESQGVARIVVERSGSLAEPITLRWWSEGGEAIADDDFAQLGERIERMAAGQARTTLFVPIVGDALPEPTETFSVVFALEAPEARLASSRTTVIIVDDD